MGDSQNIFFSIHNQLRAYFTSLRYTFLAFQAPDLSVVLRFLTSTPNYSQPHSRDCILFLLSVAPVYLCYHEPKSLYKS